MRIAEWQNDIRARTNESEFALIKDELGLITENIQPLFDTYTWNAYGEFTIYLIR